MKKIRSLVGGLLLASLVLGKKVKQDQLIEVSRDEAEKLFKDAFPKLVLPYTADIKYKIPTKEALDEFLQWWKKWLAKKRIKYIAEFFDCDNFSLLFSALALLKGLHIPIANSRTHSYNACIVHNKVKTVLVIEPQTGETLSPQVAKTDRKYKTFFLYYT